MPVLRRGEAMKIVLGLRPYMFEDALVIMLDLGWVRVFGDLSFDVTIVDGHLRIQSTQKIQ